MCTYKKRLCVRQFKSYIAATDISSVERVEVLEILEAKYDEFDCCICLLYNIVICMHEHLVHLCFIILKLYM